MFTIGDLLRGAWRDLFRDRRAERIALLQRTLDRVIGEQDVAQAECARLEDELRATFIRRAS